ncbi:similar to Saccharomyces cerevisiae YDL003W MCD1 Essential subunit of the cohesin complex required for sister chromatid cohesion in mitosis and meiosis [Maudiozyma saulgeensis]|uniref:Similar to Saccharomyces cerevisiae YDL003W MCD1 Essential subunit of the cohesin complex required for sister chromatid cohesion in mitosis and meiosis n=1 Tax=Maudiozyma saulgeensis TaxID=1789683 RepID=A0A1X7R716_9SACH|nr:similar to Saccharomyces cerevisiae YDL003W MCD1 Essential subunit of the cohesin complex required for sister chromatid cohesion in mitosis and meiosis [Kazachstania saulgeensis]
MSTKIAQPYTVLKIATDAGPLAQIWLAANMSNIPRGSVLQTSIEESAKEIAKVSGCEPEIEQNNESITLHASGELLQGIVRVYSKQAGFLLSDIKDTLTKITALFKAHSRVNVTISRISTIAKVNQLVLENTVTEKEVLSTPSLDFLDDEPQGMKQLLNGNNSMLRGVYGAAATNAIGFISADNSLEVGRRFNPDGEFEHNSSALALDFDVDEGTRTNSGSHIEIEGNDMDFPLDDPLDNNDNWDLGINEEHDDSIEVGRRAEEPLLNEHTEFGFDLDLDKNEPAIEPIEEDIEHIAPPKISSRRIKDPSLKNTMNIIVDDSSELSRNSLTEYTTNGAINNVTNRIQNKNMSQKRLSHEILTDLGYLHQSVISNLLPYHVLKKQKIDKPVQTTEKPEAFENSPPPALDISLELDNTNYINDIDSIQHDFEDIAINDNTDIGNEHDIRSSRINTQGTVLDDSLNQDLGEISTNSIVEEDNVKLKNGEVASKETIEMAEKLREYSDGSNIVYSDILSHTSKVPNQPTKADASRCFFDMLTLATSGCINLEQSSTFEDISISTLNPLYEKFIPV